MNTTKFQVNFRFGPSVEIVAFSSEQARILAQARRIELCMDYEVVNVTAMLTTKKE